jgi:2-polyprenyl-3-methyl-5-hydroxy-6-metoxy-1,4-benzoquinol methylase
MQQGELAKYLSPTCGNSYKHVRLGRPRPVEATRKPRSDDASGFFDGLASIWSASYEEDAGFRHRYEVITALLKDELAHVPPALALDAGCGSGVFSAFLGSLGWRVDALDPSPAMIDAASRQCQKVLDDDSDLVRFKVEALEDFDPGGHPYSLALCLNVLEYIRNDLSVLTAITESLAPGGMLLLSVPNRRSVVRTLERAVHWLRRLTRDDDRYLDFQRHQYTPAEIDSRMRELGFTKSRQVFWGVGFGRPTKLLETLATPWWAGMYCALYLKSAG